MAQRHNHYEAAFEAYLRERRMAYVAVSEQRRCLVPPGIFSERESLKNLDFIVSPSDWISLLVDVKGRRFPSGERSKQYWKNWTRWDDLESMARWQDRLGEGSRALLLFAYHLVGDRSPVAPERLYRFGGRWYAFLAVRVADYVQFARPLSAKWQTVAMPTRQFREAAFPFDELLPAVGE